MVTGASGILGQALCQYLLEKNQTVFALTHRHGINIGGVQEINFDMRDTDKMNGVIIDAQPEIIIHTAALTDVDACENNPDLAADLNSIATNNFAVAASQIQAKFVFISTDHLWDGTQSFVNESAIPQPLNVYAQTKWDGEQATLKADENNLVLRTNFFGRGHPWHKSFSDWIIDALRSGEKLNMFTDSHFTPISLSHLCPLIYALIVEKASGIFHVAGSERVSKYDFAKRLAKSLNLDSDLISNSIMAEATLPTPRPKDMSLSTAKVSAFLKIEMPSVDEGFASI